MSETGPDASPERTDFANRGSEQSQGEADVIPDFRDTDLSNFRVGALGNLVYQRSTECYKQKWKPITRQYLANTGYRT